MGEKNTEQFDDLLLDLETAVVAGNLDFTSTTPSPTTTRRARYSFTRSSANWRGLDWDNEMSNGWTHTSRRGLSALSSSSLRARGVKVRGRPRPITKAG